MPNTLTARQRPFASHVIPISRGVWWDRLVSLQKERRRLDQRLQLSNKIDVSGLGDSKNAWISAPIAQLRSPAGDKIACPR